MSGREGTHSQDSIMSDKQYNVINNEQHRGNSNERNHNQFNPSIPQPLNVGQNATDMK